MIYLLDTNVISDLIVGSANVTTNFESHIQQMQSVSICQPVYYEIRRGLLWKQSSNKLQILQEKIIPNLDWLALTDADWMQAAQFWADTVQQGRQLSTIDLLIAAVASRLNAAIVSSDTDFDALPVQRQDWRSPPS